jgi:diguanylate cyclase (GGDEF)-like protein
MTLQDENPEEVHALREKVRWLERKLRFDDLTGLLSRQAFYQDFEARAAAGDVLIFIDLDDFKSVNDTYGFSIGDDLLTEIAGTIRFVVADRGFVCRLAGDEFIVLLDRAHASCAEVICAELLAAIRGCRRRVGDLEVSRGASIGSCRVRRGMSAREALVIANDGLRTAKESGKNRSVRANERFHVSKPLRPSVEEVRLGLRRNEIGYHLQPIRDLASDDVWGYEALIRWHRADGQVLGPAHFLDSMTAAYDAETRPPLAQARAAAAWAAITRGKRVSFNISTAFLANLGTNGLGWVNTIVGDVPYENVIFELVETIVTRDDDDAIAHTVRMLRNLGIRIALDDFGVGRSTLGRLQTTCVDYVKIDKRFTAAAGRSRRDAAILDRTVDLAHAAGASCIVEGIESSAHLQHARSAGADLGQGFYLGCPFPASHWDAAAGA